MMKRTINVFVLGAVTLTLALFGCSSGKVADTTTPGTAAIDGVALYISDCSGCHGTLAASGKKGASVSQIQNAIAQNWGGMGAFASLSTDQLQAIATALAPVTTTTPATTASLDGVALYSTNCQGCHNALASSTKAGRTVTQIQAAIANNYGGMGRFSNLTTAQLQAIVGVLATVQAPTPAPVDASAPIDGAALYSSNCSGCHGPLATSGKRGATAFMIQNAISHDWGGMGQFSNFSSAQIAAIAGALGAAPSSTPSPTPLPAPTPATTDGAALYTTNCSSCHGPLATSSKLGASTAMIQTGISSNMGGMGRFSNFTQTQINAIAAALAPASGSSSGGTSTGGGTTTSTDGAALYTANCSSCHGPLATSSKLGATAAMIQTGISSNMGGMGQFSNFTQTQINAIAAALAPASGSSSGGTSTGGGTTTSTDGAALYAQYCQGCHGSLAASAKVGRTATQIQTAIGSVSQMSSLTTLTAAQIQAIASALATAPAPAPTDGAALYTSYCSSCHGALASSSVRGVSASTISSALSSVSQMSAISLTSTQIQAIATALGTTATPAPTPTPTTTDGASLYTQYCQGCHGTLAASSKAGRTAAQITAAIGGVSQMSSLSILTAAQIQAIASALATAPAPAPTDGAALYTSYCSSCHGALASSSVRGVSASTINSALSGVSQMRSISLTSTQIQSIATALGTTATPAPTPTPTTTDGATLYTTYCSSCHGSLATSAKAGRTAAQIQTAIGSVSQMSSLSSLTSTQINAIASALATSPAPAPTDGAGLYTSYCSSCHGALASSSVRGASASSISSALSGVSQMRSISLTSTQIQLIAGALGGSTSTSTGGGD